MSHSAHGAHLTYAGRKKKPLTQRPRRQQRKAAESRKAKEKTGRRAGRILGGRIMDQPIRIQRGTIPPGFFLSVSPRVPLREALLVCGPGAGISSGPPPYV
jgi:hypothetical protein